MARLVNECRASVDTQVKVSPTPLTASDAMSAADIASRTRGQTREVSIGRLGSARQRSSHLCSAEQRLTAPATIKFSISMTF
eukprot:1084718-Rhodomonas_salina.2